MFDDYNGHGTNARINWEEKFAKGGVGAIHFVFCTCIGRGAYPYPIRDD